MFSDFFGLHAIGKARLDSDLDLAVDAGYQLDAAEKMALIDALAELPKE